MAHDRNSSDDTKSSSDFKESNSSLEAAVVSSASILVQTQDHKPDDADDPQVTELLRQLIAADGVAKGVEERLDGIIDNLDILLSSLESELRSSETLVLEKTKATSS